MTAPTYTPDKPELYVTEAGTPGAPTLLLLHAVATSGWMWEQQAERLSDFHLLIPDLPGHGASNTVPWWSLDETVKLLAELIARKATEGRVHVVGLSLGAYVGLRLVEHFPERVGRALLSGVNVLPFPNARVMGLMGYVILPFLKTDLFLKANARGLRIPEVQYAGYRRSAKSMSRRAYLTIGRELMRFGLSAEADRITCPTLVVAGEREQALIRQSVQRLAAVLPDAQGYLVPRVRHGWSGEAPELFTQTVRAWVTKQPLPEGLVRVER